MTPVMNILLDDEHGTPRPLQDADMLDANDWEADYDGSQCPEGDNGLTIVDKPYITAAGTCFQPTHD